jgi:hypothetical protein
MPSRNLPDINVDIDASLQDKLTQENEPRPVGSEEAAKKNFEGRSSIFTTIPPMPPRNVPRPSTS